MSNKFGKWGGKFWGDTGERVVAGFISTLIPTWIAVGNVANLDFVNALQVSGSAAGLVLLKCIFANVATGDVPSASAVGVSSLSSDVPPS